MFFSACVLAGLLVLPLVAQIPGKEETPSRAGNTAAPPAKGFDEIAKQATEARENSRLLDAIRLYRQAVELRPSWTEGWWYLGTILYDLDRYAEARDALRRFVALDANAGPGHALLGLCLYQTREYDLALAHLRRARILGFGGNRQIEQVALYHTAILLTRFEHYEEALEIFAWFAQQGNDNPMVVEAAGLAAMRKPLLPVKLPPQEREIVLLAGKAWHLAAARRPADAELAYQALLARYPDAPNVHYIYGSFLLSSRPDDGLKQLLRELEISPRHLPALVLVALEYQKRGDPSTGLRYAQEAVKIAPQSFAAHTALGRLLVDSGELDKGIQALEQARSLAPDSPQTRFALSSAYAKAGRKEEAAREREEFLRLKKLAEQIGKGQ